MDNYLIKLDVRFATASGWLQRLVRRRSKKRHCVLPSRCCRAQILPDPGCDSTRADPASKAVRGCKPFTERFDAATRIASSADDNQIVLFETLRPIKRTATVKMLDCRL